MLYRRADFLAVFQTLLAFLAAVAFAKEESSSSKSRDKRQQIAFHLRKSRLPPYAVQMEPIVQYSQRDPLYNPLASSKNDDLYEETPLSYYPQEPEPIIEIIIKESNESLPTPVPPPPPPPPLQPRPKEPIQVFYVKYEKKKGYGDKTRVVYDPPIPALTPVEEHEEIKPDNSVPYAEEPTYTATPAPEPSTTLRAIIRPDSEVYHSGSSGIRVTFGTEQIPPNGHSKRSDLETPGSDTQQKQHTSKPTALPGSPKRQHGPYQPLQPPVPSSV